MVDELMEACIGTRDKVRKFDNVGKLFFHDDRREGGI